MTLADRRHAMVMIAFLYATVGLSNWPAQVMQYTFFHEEMTKGVTFTNPIEQAAHHLENFRLATFSLLGMAALLVIAVIFLRRWSNPERWPTETAEDRSN